MYFIELLEEIKKAQRARLEDQRGTKINFDLPDFLKSSKEAAQKQMLAECNSGYLMKPQPAPRHSLLNSKQQTVMNRIQSLEARNELPSNRNSFEFETHVNGMYNGTYCLRIIVKTFFLQVTLWFSSIIPARDVIVDQTIIHIFIMTWIAAMSR